MESRGNRIRDELLAIEQFDTPLEARVLVPDGRMEDHTYLLPHSALGRLTQAEFTDR